jgi:hypothetical protein
MGFDCCGAWMGNAMNECPCGSIVQRHPVITSAILVFMGLTCLLISAGAILGILAFFRTF